MEICFALQKLLKYCPRINLTVTLKSLAKSLLTFPKGFLERALEFTEDQAEKFDSESLKIAEKWSTLSS